MHDRRTFFAASAGLLASGSLLQDTEPITSCYFYVDEKRGAVSLSHVGDETTRGQFGAAALYPCLKATRKFAITEICEEYLPKQNRFFSKVTYRALTPRQKKEVVNAVESQYCESRCCELSMPEKWLFDEGKNGELYLSVETLNGKVTSGLQKRVYDTTKRMRRLTLHKDKPHHNNRRYVTYRVWLRRNETMDDFYESFSREFNKKRSNGINRTN